MTIDLHFLNPWNMDNLMIPAMQTPLRQKWCRHVLSRGGSGRGSVHAALEVPHF